MPFKKAIRSDVLTYSQAHIGNEAWHTDFFDFIKNPVLKKRLGKEFWSARFIYKLLEGLHATKTLKRAQIKLQVLQYASIYEAVIHHLLFTKYKSHSLVKELLISTRQTAISISASSLKRLEKETRIPKKEISVIRKRPGKADITKIRFDRKADAAEKIGLITSSLRKELVELFTARNSIHIHAEIRKGIKYQIELSKMAYRRMKPFRDCVIQQLIKDGII